jgi:hypothetical protein
MENNNKFSNQILFSDTIDVNINEAIKLGEHFKPSIILHRMTNYIPMDIDLYINKCKISTWDEILKQKPTNLEPDIEALDKIQFNIIPTVHYIVRKINNNHSLENYFVIHYILFYSNQPDTHICYGRPYCMTARNTGHQADIEWISMLVNNEMKVEYTYYACHGSRESMWFNENNRTNLINNKIPVYVALDTNGSYPTGGSKIRLFGFHRDRCGDKILDYQLKYLPENHPWRLYQGNMGLDGIGSLGNEGRLNLPAPNNINFSMETQFKRRFFRYN